MGNCCDTELEHYHRSENNGPRSIDRSKFKKISVSEIFIIENWYWWF